MYHLWNKVFGNLVKIFLLSNCACKSIPHMSIFKFANNALLGGGVRLGLVNKKGQKKIKGTTKPLMATLDITRLFPSKVTDLLVP